MQEQAKRGPGRPRKNKRRERIDITLAVETIEYLDACYSMTRSQFIEMCIAEYRKSHVQPPASPS